eukprot:6479655-Amphidinium_carterae.2
MPDISCDGKTTVHNGKNVRSFGRSAIVKCEGLFRLRVPRRFATELNPFITEGMMSSQPGPWQHRCTWPASRVILWPHGFVACPALPKHHATSAI